MSSPLGFSEYVGDITPLETNVEFTRFCPKCDSEQTFIAGWQCESGLVGCCLGCGDERIAPFTRVNSEVA
jgi:hypothetical protein